MLYEAKEKNCIEIKPFSHGPIVRLTHAERNVIVVQFHALFPIDSSGFVVRCQIAKKCE